MAADESVIDILSPESRTSFETSHSRPKNTFTPASVVLELTDSDDDNALPQAGPSSRSTRTTTRSLLQKKARDSGPAFTRRHKSSSIGPQPLFVSSDHEDDPLATAINLAVGAPTGIVESTAPEHPLGDTQLLTVLPTPPVDPIQEPKPDPVSRHVTQILEIIPDVDPDHLLALVTKFFPAHQDGILEYVLHILFEDPTYPKVDKTKKGKRKHSDDNDGDEGGVEQAKRDLHPAKKPRNDYGSKARPFNGGLHYKDLALEQLQNDFPCIPKSYLKLTFTSMNGLYAPTYFSLSEQERRQSQDQEVRLPYTRRIIPFRPSTKGKKRAMHDAELDEERAWVVEETSRRSQEVAEQEEYEDSGDGIECGCCFSIYPFDKMIQCSEAHLFCSTCMSSYASTLLGSHDHNIKCMHQSGCTAAIPPSELRRFLSKNMMDLWERVKQRKEVEAAGLEGLEECPFCEWGCVIENEEEKLFKCGNMDGCGVVSCRRCKKIDHLPKSCKEVDEDKNLDGRHTIEEAMTRALMRNCPKCQKAFIKENGCNKMTCPNCRTLSCYVCRQLITGYDHFNHTNACLIDPTTSTNANQCLLWDHVERRHAEEVKQAADRALAEYKRDHPDIDEHELKIDLPPIPPAPPNPNPLPQAPMVGLNAGAHNELNQRLVRLAQLQLDEQNHRVRIRRWGEEVAMYRRYEGMYPWHADFYRQRIDKVAADLDRERVVGLRMAQELVEERQHVQAARLHVQPVPAFVAGVNFNAGHIPAAAAPAAVVAPARRGPGRKARRKRR